MRACARARVRINGHEIFSTIPIGMLLSCWPINLDISTPTSLSYSLHMCPCARCGCFVVFNSLHNVDVRYIDNKCQYDWRHCFTLYVIYILFCFVCLMHGIRLHVHFVYVQICCTCNKQNRNHFINNSLSNFCPHTHTWYRQMSRVQQKSLIEQHFAFSFVIFSRNVFHKEHKTPSKQHKYHRYNSIRYTMQIHSLTANFNELNCLVLWQWKI